MPTFLSLHTPSHTHTPQSGLDREQNLSQTVWTVLKKETWEVREPKNSEKQKDFTNLRVERARNRHTVRRVQ